MTPLARTAAVAPAARLDMTAEFGWRRLAAGGLTLWFKGHLHDADPPALAGRLAATPAERWAEIVAGLDGHFALAAAGPQAVLAATDRIGSIPLLYARDGAGWVVGADARRLPAPEAADPAAALEIAMAGYTIGRKTLYPGIEALGAGETVLFRPGAAPVRTTYYSYLPAPEGEARDPALRRRLAAVTMGLFEKMAAGLGGRTVALPLSAGLDSRLVAAALAEIGYGPVVCFSYGLAGNHEAEAARRIAARLGQAWHFVPHTPAGQAALFASAGCRAFEAFADALDAIPFQQDLYAVGALKASGAVPADAVFVNGQSGDFITGNHVPAGLLQAPPAADEAARWARITDALIAKHFSLWAALMTPANRTRIAGRLKADIEAAGGALGAPANDFALYELSEFRNRQAKYVIAGQRSYEWHGFDWRLPLWDRDYLDFWRRAPRAAKAGQALYREMLEAENWGGVWGEGWHFPRTVRPGWLRPLRTAAKAAHAPLGRTRWHRFEKRYIDWWMDTVCNYAVAPYGRVARDRRGHRNAIAWHAERYLARKGLGLDGAPLRPGGRCG